MTTICDTAARRFKKPVALAILTSLAALGLGGCETGGNLFGGSNDNSVATDQTLAPAGETAAAKVAIAPPLGPPDNVNKMFQSQLGGAIEKQRVTVAKAATDKSEYTVRGYIVSAAEKGKTKVSYIWDLTDRTGKQVNRISGEELVATGASKDPWSAVTPQVVDQISNKTATSIAAWLATQGPSSPAVATTAPAGTPPSPANNLAPVATAPASGTPVAAAQPAAAPAGPTTGSIGREAVTTMVPAVVGAPGDGGVSLTNALQAELRKNGVALGTTPGTQTYRVNGKVAVGQAKDGKQPIAIDWVVSDPAGKKLGTVSQKNEIPQGSVDGAWGQTASAAAQAAAQGIVKLLPATTKVN